MSTKKQVTAKRGRPPQTVAQVNRELDRIQEWVDRARQKLEGKASSDPVTNTAAYASAGKGKTCNLILVSKKQA